MEYTMESFREAFSEEYSSWLKGELLIHLTNEYSVAEDLMDHLLAVRNVEPEFQEDIKAEMRDVVGEFLSELNYN
jgi:hypothetical protein